MRLELRQNIIKIREWLAVWQRPELGGTKTWVQQARLCVLAACVLGLAGGAAALLLWPASPWAVALCATLAAAAGAGILSERLLLAPLLHQQARQMTEIQTLRQKALSAPIPLPQVEEDSDGMLSALVAENQRLLEMQSKDSRSSQWVGAQLGSLLDLSEDALVLTDPAGLIKGLSERAALLFNLHRSSVVGTDFNEVAKIYDGERKPPQQHPIRGLVQRAIESNSSMPAMISALIGGSADELIPVIITSVSVRSNGQVVGAAIRIVSSGAAPVAGGAAARWSLKDPNTDLLTREVFLRRTDELIELARAQSDGHALLMIAVDGLSDISARLGHVAADEMLWQVARILEEEVGTAGDCYRISSDHFAVLLAFSNLEQAKLLADRMRDRVDGWEFEWKESRFDSTLSLSVTPVEAQTQSRTELLDHASQGLLSARQLGGNSVSVHSSDENLAQLRRDDRAWIEWLLPRLEDSRLHLISQSARPLKAGSKLRPVFEVFVRLEDEDGGWLAPGSFMPAALRHNLTGRVDAAVLSRLLRILAEQHHLGETHEFASLNISGPSILDADFIGQVTQLLRGEPMAAKHVCFEVDETFAISHIAEMQRFCEATQPLGARCALDRCRAVVPPGGIRRLPLYMVKVHEALVRRMLVDPIDSAKLGWIAQANQMLGRVTLAMGVENEESLIALNRLGLDYAQGVHVNKMGPLML